MTRHGVASAAGVGAVVAFVAADLARTGDNAGTTYAGTTWVATIAMTVAAVSLFAAAPLARSRSLGFVTVGAGVCSLAPVVVAWSAGPPVVRAAAALAAAFLLPLLAHAALAAPRGEIAGGSARSVVAAAYVWSTFSAVTLALVRDPFYDVSCWSDCDGNAFLVKPAPGLADALVHARPWVELGLGIGVVVLGVRTLAHSGWAARLSGLAAGAVGAITGLHASRVMGARFEDPLDPTFRAIFLGACCAAALTACAVAAPRGLARRRRHDVARMVAALDDAPAPDALERRLGAGLGDPELRIVFWLPELGRSVDVAGVACDVPGSVRRAVTPLVRRGQTVGWIVHDPAVTAAVEPALTAAVRLAMDNARLRAGLLAQVSDLRDARRRIVGEGDDERRRLERDLHDGVQQQLLALATELRAAAARARALEDPAGVALESAGAAMAAVLEEVRAVAHGIHPAILTDAGLAAAVASLADVAPLPVAVAQAPPTRYPAAVETAAYQVVAEGIANAAAHSAASVVDVDIAADDGTLLVRVHDDGRGGAEVRRVGGLAELVDRVGAIDGTLSVESTGASGTTISAAIPCAS